MKHQQTTRFLIFTYAVFLFLFLGVASGMAADKPNILVIFGDDIGMYNESAYFVIRERGIEAAKKNG